MNQNYCLRMNFVSLVFVLILSVIFMSRMDLSAEEAGALELKTILLNDFGYDLPISGLEKNARSKANPIVILSDNPEEILYTAYLTVQGLQRGRTLAMNDSSSNTGVKGVLWRPVTFGVDADDNQSLYYLRIERFVLSAGKEMRETAKYYFTLPHWRSNEELSLDDLPVLNFSVSGINLARSLGYLHYDEAQSVNYELTRKTYRLGQGLAFGALGVKATVFLYPAPQGVESKDALKREFEKSSSDVMIANISAEAWPDRNQSEKKLTRFWMLGEEAEQATRLSISLLNGLFIRVRITWVRDHTLDSVAMNFLSYF